MRLIDESGLGAAGRTHPVLEAEIVRQRRLSSLNARRLQPAWTAPTELELCAEAAARADEDEFVTREREAVAAFLDAVPDQPAAFIDWFAALRDRGPGQHDPLFPWLASHASREDLQWFLGQEVAGEAGFEDLLALTQVRMPMGPKLEMARNFWDELGRARRWGCTVPCWSGWRKRYRCTSRPATSSGHRWPCPT